MQTRTRIAQTRAIPLGITRKWRPGSLLLPEWQVETQNDIAPLGKSVAERDQERRTAIRASAVSQDQPVAVCILRQVPRAAYGGVNRIIKKNNRGIHDVKA